MIRRGWARPLHWLGADRTPEQKREGTMKQPARRPKETIRGEMRYRPLGRTGEEVSVIALGGHHIGRQKHEKDSIQIVRAAVDAAFNFWDTSGAFTLAAVRT